MYIVVPIADSEKVHEAIGRLYAASINEVYPIRSHFSNGEIDPDITHSTFYWCDPQVSRDGTEVAFPVDETLEPLLGQSIETTLGNCNVPTEQRNLDASWFPAPPPDI